MGPQNCRSFGFAQDDKKEGATAYRGAVDEPRLFQIKMSEI
jgi:hypothetical protein